MIAPLAVRRARAGSEAPPAARSEQNTKEKFCFSFRRNPARAYQKQRTKLFFGVASVSERRRGGSVFPLKKGSRKVYNYSIFFS
jgi:hypothetical protein